MTQQDILKPLIASLAVLAAIGCGDAVPAGSAESSTLNYAAWAYDGEGLTLVDDELPGMILMRELREASGRMAFVYGTLVNDKAFLLE